jgi:Ser/Thr protein kinase RdoA (MazF antagonist)
VRAALNAIPTVASGHDSVLGHETELLHLTQMLHGKYEELAEEVDRAGFGNWAPVIIHGDWHPGNMLFREGKVCALLDFDAARYQPRIVDIAYGMLQFSILRAESSLDQWPDFFDEARMRRFLAGYCGQDTIPAGERTVIPSLMMEALTAEAVLPIAVTGSFGSLPGFGVLQMVARKVRWLEDNSERMRRWLTE